MEHVRSHIAIIVVFSAARHMMLMFPQEHLTLVNTCSPPAAMRVYIGLSVPVWMPCVVVWIALFCTKILMNTAIQTNFGYPLFLSWRQFIAAVDTHSL